MYNFENDIKESLRVLREAGLILYPTDTVWGLGCDPTRPEAVEKIFRLKSREESRSLLVLVSDLAMLERYVKQVPDMAFELVSVSETPLTIVYPGGKNLAGGVCSADGSVGIRICLDPFCNELIRRFRKPLVSTSANISGQPSPSCFGEIDQRVKSAVDYIVEHRQNDRQKSKPSPVVKIEDNGTFKILRK
jgi:L-threonylcarbamoyladenylate synthase